jgi:hypothetical protein
MFVVVVKSKFNLLNSPKKKLKVDFDVVVKSKFSLLNSPKKN